jgi:hypothetical protein
VAVEGCKEGIPYALSIMFASATRDRCREGELGLPMVFNGVSSWRELGESRRFDQGGIAQLGAGYFTTQKEFEA